MGWLSVRETVCWLAPRGYRTKVPLPTLRTESAPERFLGTVQWIGGQTMALMLADGSSVRVDLTQVDQDNYQRLTAGDRVVVTATLPPARDRLIAMSIDPAPEMRGQRQSGADRHRTSTRANALAPQVRLRAAADPAYDNDPMTDGRASDDKPRFEVRPTVDTHFSWLRTRLSTERTLMSWCERPCR